MTDAEVKLESLNYKLDLVLLKLDRAEREMGRMSAELDALKTQVERNTSVTQSAVTLINGLAEQIEDLKDDPAELTRLAADLKAQGDSLAAAVTQNTPAPPGP